MADSIKLIQWPFLRSKSLDSDRSVAIMTEGDADEADKTTVREALGLAETDSPTFAGLQLTGDLLLSDTTWDDIRIIPSAFDFAGNADPTNVAVSIGNMTFRLYEFATSDEAYCTVQMPHGYKRGSTLRPHVHWTPGTRGNEEAGKSVAWKAQISCAQYGEVFSDAVTVDLTSTLGESAVDGEHVIGPSADYEVPATFGESGMLLIRLYRDFGDSWVGTSSGSRPLLLEFDIHYQMDKLGSDDEIPD